MDVELYVYDLSGGMARQYSVALTGVYIDAIYHTAVVLGGVEYFFGQGIHRKIPGSTHHGRPMEILKMGRSDLPMDVIEEYVQSLEPIYTPESYDLFVHNCNNFSQDLCMFLVGKSIPEKISSLPETFLKTPIGQMLRGQIDQSMRRMTQAPDAVSGQNVRNSSNPQIKNGLKPTHTNGFHPTRPAFINSMPKGQSRSNHSHASLKLPLLSKRITEPILATTYPPLDKLLARIASTAHGVDTEYLNGLASHVKRRQADGSVNAPLPDMQAISSWINNNFNTCGDAQFAIVDLLRVAALDPRVSAYLATDTALLNTTFSKYAGADEIPYNLHFTTLQLALNLFTSPVAQEALLSVSSDCRLRAHLSALLSTSLLRQNAKIRLQAALLTINFAAIDHNQRLDGQDDIVRLETMGEGAIETALLQSLSEETDASTVEKLALALGLMLYRSSSEEGIWELCEVMGIRDILEGRESKVGVAAEVSLLLKRK